MSKLNFGSNRDQTEQIFDLYVKISELLENKNVIEILSAVGYFLIEFIYKLEDYTDKYLTEDISKEQKTFIFPPELLETREKLEDILSMHHKLKLFNIDTFTEMSKNQDQKIKEENHE